MKNVDNIIEQIKQGIKQQEMLIAKEDPKTEEGYKNIAFYKSKIRELEYRINELEEKNKCNSSILIPKYNDGKYASDKYKESFDMLRVCYFKYFHQDPSFSPVSKWDMMFYDSTLYLPVDTYLIKGKIPFKIMFCANYLDHKADSSKSVSIELPFEILSREENEDYLKCMLELIKIYSGDSVNLVLGNGISTRGMLSYIADRDLNRYSNKEIEYYDFFNSLCDNNVRNIIYIGDSMKQGVKREVIDKVQSNIIDLNKRLTTTSNTNGIKTEQELEKANQKIKKRILSINNNL